MIQPAASDPAGIVADDEVLFRRLTFASPMSLIVVDTLTGERRATSAAFKPHPTRDPDGLSVYSGSMLASDGLTPDSIANEDRDSVASLLAVVPRSITLDVVADPQADEIGSRAPRRGRAHALINRWPEGTGRVAKLAKKLALAAILVIDPH